MRLLSLKLLNYRRFHQEELIFQDDFSLIFWKNWAGKSSLLDAIWFALFGPWSRDFVRVNRDFQRSYFLKEREPSKVELTFQYWFEQYKVVRVIDAGIKKFASEFIVENKDILFWPQWLEIVWWEEITQYLVQLLWVSKDTFLRSVFTKQKDLEVLSWGLSERKELINKVLWLDKIEEIIEQLKKQEKEEKITLDILKQKLQTFDSQGLEKQMQDIQEKYKKTCLQISVSQAEYESLQVHFHQVKTQFEMIEKKKNDFQSLQNQQSLKQQQMQNSSALILRQKQEIQEIQWYESYLEQNAFLIDEHKKYEQKVLEWEKNKTYFQYKQQLQHEVNQIVQDEKKYFQESQSLLEKTFMVSWQENNWNDFQELYMKQKSHLMIQIQENETMRIQKMERKWYLEAQMMNLKWAWEQLKKELDIIQQLGMNSPCPTCKRPLREDFPWLVELFEKDLVQKRTEYKQFSQEVTELNNEIEKSIIQDKEYKNIWESLSLAEKNMGILYEKILNTQKRYAELTEQINKIPLVEYDEKIYLEDKKNLQIYNTKLEEYNQKKWQVLKKEFLAKELSQSQQLLENLQKDIEQIRKDINFLQFDDNEFLKIKNEYHSFYTKHHEKSLEISTLQKSWMELEFQLKDLQNQKQRFLDDTQQIHVHVHTLHIISMKKQILSDYMYYLLGYLKPRIEDLASEYFTLITDNKYSSLTLDEDYTILIDGKHLDLYSGGERDLANLCFRLSLWQNMTSNKWNPINFLVLDEVLASQDKGRQQNILLHLKKLERKFSQIILISHVEEMKDLATHLIEVYAISKDESTILYHE